MTLAVLVLKVILDVFATAAFLVSRQWPMALMFSGFAVADLGAAWIALK
jgi:hypothetical protein